MDFDYKKYKHAIETEFTIVNKDKQEVPFILNKAQDNFLENLTERNVILKARKMGFSSVILAIGVIKFLFGKNERIVSMSFDADASSKQLERAKHYIRSFELAHGIKIPMKYNSKTEMVYEGIDQQTGRPFTNTLRIGTARSDSYGRGDDITFLHLTEVSLADNLDELLAGVTQAAVNNAIVIFETTANGFNSFKDFYDKSMLGGTGFKATFYGPEWEYDQDFLDKKKKELGVKFPQEYPSTDLEAFLHSGSGFFDQTALGDLFSQCREPFADDDPRCIYNI